MTGNQLGFVVETFELSERKNETWSGVQWRAPLSKSVAAFASSCRLGNVRQLRLVEKCANWDLRVVEHGVSCRGSLPWKLVMNAARGLHADPVREKE